MSNFPNSQQYHYLKGGGGRPIYPERKGFYLLYICIHLAFSTLPGTRKAFNKYFLNELMGWPGGKWKSCWGQHSKSWHCSATKTISRIRVIKVGAGIWRCIFKVSSRGLFPELASSHLRATYRGLRLLFSLTLPGKLLPCLSTPTPLFFLLRLGFHSQKLSTRFYLADLTQASWPFQGFPSIAQRDATPC